MTKRRVHGVRTSLGFQLPVLGAFALAKSSSCRVAGLGLVKAPEPVYSACGPMGAMPTKNGLSLLLASSRKPSPFSLTRSVLYWFGAGAGGDWFRWKVAFQ